MDWKEVLAKLKLADIKAEGKQVGAVNVNIENKTENKTYNFHFYNPEAAKAFVADFKITPDLEKKVKEEAERRLISLGISPDLLSETTRAEIARVVTVSSVESTVKIRGLETLAIQEKAIVKLDPESDK